MKQYASEEEIVDLLDAFMAADLDAEEARRHKPVVKSLPSPCTIEEYQSVMSTNAAEQKKYEDAVTEARLRWKEADRKLFNAIPHLVWIKLPSRGISIGFSTGTWGGGCHYLHVVNEGDPLPKLEHQTYYS